MNYLRKVVVFVHNHMIAIQAIPGDIEITGTVNGHKMLTAGADTVVTVHVTGYEPEKFEGAGWYFVIPPEAAYYVVERNNAP